MRGVFLVIAAKYVIVPMDGDSNFGLGVRRLIFVHTAKVEHCKQLEGECEA